MKNFVKAFIVCVCVFTLCFIGASAAEITVGSDVASFAEAIASLDGEGGIVILTGETDLSGITVPEQSDDLTITAATGGRILLSGDLTFAKNTNGNTVVIDAPVSVTSESAAIFGGFNSIHFTENCAVEGKLDFYGGLDSAKNSYAGKANRIVNNANNANIITTLEYSITVDGGSFRIFAGGNRRPNRTSIIGSIAAPLTVTINGGTFGEGVSFSADSPIKNEQAFSLSGMGILADDATLVINDGTFNVPIYAQGYLGELCTNASGGSQITKSDSKYYAIDGDIKIKVNGGTLYGCEINAFQNCAGYSQLLRGDYVLTVDDGVSFPNGIVFDATQVKAYAGDNKTATLSCPTDKDVTYKRFDFVNGERCSYEEPLRIACIGDSITQGYGTTASSETESYPAQLLKYLAGEGAERIDNRDVIVGNFGCSSTRVMDYSDQQYNDMLAFVISTEEADADIVIIGLGTNDSGYSSINLGQHEHFTRDYTALLKAYGKCSDTEKVYGTTAIYRGGVYALGAINVRSLQKDVMADLAADSDKYVCIDLYALTLDAALDGTLLSSDQLHPATSGYKIYMETIADAIIDGKCSVDGFELSDIYVAADGGNVADCTEAVPTGNLSIAFARAGENSTLHVSGRVKASLPGELYCLFTPKVESFKIVGETDDAAIYTNGKLFQVQSDFEIDNIELSTTSQGSIMIQCGYNNATFGDGFVTLASNSPLITGGYVSFSSDERFIYYTTPKIVSSDKNCTINVNGGTYNYMMGGNYLYYSDSKIGTYSGDMVFNVGENVTVNYSAYSAAAGTTYVTGSITMNIGSWLENTVIPEVMLRDDSVVENYEPANNTGVISVNIASGVAASASVNGDLDGDGDADLSDLLEMIGYMLDGGFDRADRYYGKSEIRLIDVAVAFDKLAD